MPKNSYQYGTSPRKYEPEYTPRTRKKVTENTITKKSNKSTKQLDSKKHIKDQRAKKIQEIKSKTLQILGVIVVFGMLLALSYREITIMEMFNQKKNLETQLATIQKENGQVEKSIREQESKLNWNDIQTIAKEQLGMQTKKVVKLDLEKSDNVETKYKFIKEEEISIIEKIIAYFINK